MLIDASVRDVGELRQLGLPIWARFVRVRGATKNALGTINAPVEVGGMSIRAGDVVILDADGAVVVAAERAAEILQAGLAREAKEADLRAKFQAGQISIDVCGMREQVAAVLE